MFASETICAQPVLRGQPENTPLDIVVPFTSPALTQAALDRADQFIQNEDVQVRVIAVQTVPILLPLDRPPVSSDHWKAVIRKLLWRAPAKGEIYLVRDAAYAWAWLLRQRSVIVIASRWRPWRTAEERLARTLHRQGHEVLLVYAR